MPSPIAHAAVVLLAPPLLAGGDIARLSPTRRMAFYALITIALCIPDIDFAIPLFTGFTKHQAHGAWLHSLLAGALSGELFAAAARPVVRRVWSWPRLVLLGAACYWLHLLMDAFTNGRGVMMLWPITSERIRSPWWIFTGIHWSDPGRWDLHLRTALNEGVFALLVGVVALALTLRARRAAEASP